MKARTCNLLTIALTAALACPLASAQSLTGQLNATGQAATGVAQELPRAPDLPPVADPQDTIDRTEAPMTSATAQAQGDIDAAGHAAVDDRELWMRLDADNDGRISADEGRVDAGFAGRFAVLDGDGDGFVSDAEFRADAQIEHPDMPVPRASEQGVAHAAANSAVGQSAVWADLDADSDGRISRAEGEVDAGFVGDFDAMDGDGDGFIDDREYRDFARTDRIEEHTGTLGEWHGDDAVDEGMMDDDMTDDTDDDAMDDTTIDDQPPEPEESDDGI